MNIGKPTPTVDRSTEPPVTPATHVKVAFSWGVVFLMPIDDAAKLLPIIGRALRVDWDTYAGGWEVYTSKGSADITIEYLPRRSQVLPINVSTALADEYRQVFAATYALRGDGADMSDFTFQRFMVDRSTD